MSRKVAMLVCLSFLVPFQGMAHAILMSSRPGVRQVVKSPELAVELTFNSRIDGKRSRLKLLAPDGSESVLPIDNQRSPETLTTHAKGLKGGAYVLRWQVLANDGHITRGEIPFNVQ